MKIIAYIAAAVLILFAVLFILSAFDPVGGQMSSFLVGGAMALIAFGLIWFASRKPKVETPANVTYKVDLGGDVKLETMKCKSCGGTLTSENVKLVAGAPVVTCPFCGSIYQLTEEPKW